MATSACKLKSNCDHIASELSKQLNSFTGKYAYKYPTCETIECKTCPYDAKEKRELTEEQRKIINLWCNEFCITPQNQVGEELDDVQKEKLMCEFLDENRTLFRREEERIIYTEAFRRLQYKTQVMVNSASDDQRTRLLHSLEVQKISRKIAVALRANFELAETISVAHDIGHTPFGHAGETAIRNFLEENLAGSFSHALQSVKVLDFLCSHRILRPEGLKGLGISDFVLEGVLKHDSDSFSDNVSSAAYRLQYDCSRLYRPVGEQPDLYSDQELCIGGIESQIVCWADKIAYLGHDWEEFVAIGLIETMLSRVNSMVIQIDDLLNKQDQSAYKHLSAIEVDKLKLIHKKFVLLKEELYSKEYNLNENAKNRFLNLLKSLIATYDDTITLQKEHPTSFVFFSGEQYKTLASFFKATKSWIIITGKMPQIVGGKMDIIFVFYRYLCETTAHRVIPALIDALVQNSKCNLSPDGADDKSRTSVIKECNDSLLRVKEASRKNCLNEVDCKKRIKAGTKQSFAVRFDEEYSKAISDINTLIFDEYISSTRVRYMTQKAETIIRQLLSFYCENDQMLPLKQRKRIEFETSVPAIVNRTKHLLIQYYLDLIDGYIKESERSGKSKSIYLDRISEKMPGLKLWELLDSDSISLEDVKEKVKKEMAEHSQLVSDAIKLRVVADYVSGMTDRMAEKKYNEICSSSTYWSKAYSERSTINV